MDKQKGKLTILAQTGCNTTLLNFYTECKLCSKFSFPDFRLSAGRYAAGAAATGGGVPKIINLCENCVETVLTLCLPTEPEVLPEPEECLALGEPRNTGHRLVLSNNLKKWLSLDGVNLIKKTVDEFDDNKAAQVDVNNVFLEAMKRHCIAVIKTCMRDEDITGCAAGFCITDTFLNGGNTKLDDETAAALASLEAQIGVPVREKPRGPVLKPNEVQVTILSRRRGYRKLNAPFGQGQKQPGPTKPATITPLRTAGATPKPVTEVKASPSSSATSPKKDAPSSSEEKKEQQNEESVSAIQSFLDATSSPNGGNEETNKSDNDGGDVKVPAGVRITPAGKGTVNIRAVSEAAANAAASNAKDKVNSNGKVQNDSSEDEDEDVKTPASKRRRGRGRSGSESEPASKRARRSSASAGDASDSDSTPGRTRRARKEKKIFDL